MVKLMSAAQFDGVSMRDPELRRSLGTPMKLLRKPNLKL
jgi:hypothetical protein